ncbi:MAG: FAD-dependent oxidoreductase [Candidatus Sulfotelmatobacter sp.]
MPDNNKKVDVLIIGAGPSGLGAAWRLSSHLREGQAPSFVLVDNHTRPGGWARSVNRNGFTFDFGGHVFFPHKHYRLFGDLVTQLPIQWSSSCPERGTWTAGRFIPYPVQQNIHRLPTAVFMKCLAGLATQRLKRKFSAGIPPIHLEDYLTHTFGGPLKDALLGPLNHKMWAHPTRDLDTNWVTYRSGSAACNIPEVNLSRMVWQFISSGDSPGWDADTKVNYPVGGSGEIWRQVTKFLDPAKLRFGTSLIRIDPEAHLAFLSDGSVYRYEHVISAVPLDNLLRALSYQGDLSAMAGLLKYSRSYVVGLGIRGSLPPQFKTVHSLLVPDSDIAFWRLSFPSNVSAGNVPSAGPCWSGLCEISQLPSAGRMASKAEVLRDVVSGLLKMGLLRNEGDVLTHFCVRLEHGYPTPFLGRDSVLNEIQPRLEALGILSRGRFGGWKYEVSNQDHAFMQGVEAADLTTLGKAEETYTNAQLVNC